MSNHCAKCGALVALVAAVYVCNCAVSPHNCAPSPRADEYCSMGLRVTLPGDDEPTSSIRLPDQDLRSIASSGPSGGGVTGTAATFQRPQTGNAVGTVTHPD